MRKSLSFLFFYVMLVASAAAQSSKISGRVVASEDKLPLSGVSVSIKGQNCRNPNSCQWFFFH